MPGKRLHLFKYQTLGNSYLVLDPRDRFNSPKLASLSNGALARFLCDKAWGIGAYGMLFGPEQIQDEKLGFRIINSDGSPAGFSGNGARIFVKYLLDVGYLSTGSSFHIAAIAPGKDGATAINRIPATIATDGLTISVTAPQRPDFGVDAVAANPAAVRKSDLADETIVWTVPAIAQIRAGIMEGNGAWTESTFVFIGNPHCVTFVNSPTDLPTFENLQRASTALRTIAYRPERGVERKAVFTDGCNLQWAHVASRTHIQLMIYERGEGPTLASGSSSIAAAVAAFARGLVENKVDVEMPGGTLQISILGSPDQIYGVALIGAAARIAELWIDEATIAYGAPG